MKTYYSSQLTNFSASLILTILIFFGLATPLAHAQLFSGPKDDACAAVGAADSKGRCNDATLKSSATSLSKTLKNIINVISVVVGIAAVIMLIISGIRYITSAGDSGQITSAKHTFIYALVGLIIVALAQVIVKFIIEKI